jgi:hypothetical protein
MLILTEQSARVLDRFEGISISFFHRDGNQWKKCQPIDALWSFAPDGRSLCRIRRISPAGGDGGVYK